MGIQKGEANTKFSIREYIETYRASRGERAEHEGEMMWEGAPMEFSKTAKGWISQSHGSLCQLGSVACKE